MKNILLILLSCMCINVHAQAKTHVIYKPAIKNSRNKYTVIIDAGHQKKGNLSLETIGPHSKKRKYKVSGGARGHYSKIYESTINLQVAKQLKKVLVHKGYRVVMVRTSQYVDISNQKRAAIANRYLKNSIFIRIHCDDSNSSRMHGFSLQSPTAHNRFMGHKLAHKSIQLGKDIAKGYHAKTHLKYNGMYHRDDLTGTNYAKIPTALIELGFLSHYSDEKKLISPSFQKKAARGMTAGIDHYFNKK